MNLNGKSRNGFKLIFNRSHRKNLAHKLNPLPSHLSNFSLAIMVHDRRLPGLQVRWLNMCYGVVNICHSHIITASGRLSRSLEFSKFADWAVKDPLSRLKFTNHYL